MADEQDESVCRNCHLQGNPRTVVTADGTKVIVYQCPNCYLEWQASRIGQPRPRT